MSGVYEFSFVANDKHIIVRFTGTPKISIDDCEALGKVDSLSRRQWALDLLANLPPGMQQELRIVGFNLLPHNLFAKELLNENWIRGVVSHSVTHTGTMLAVHRYTGNFYLFIYCI